MIMMIIIIIIIIIYSRVADAVALGVDKKARPTGAQYDMIEYTILQYSMI